MSTPEIREVEVIRPQPGDVIVYRTDEELTYAVCASIDRRLQALFPDHRCAVIAGGRLEVVRPDAETVPSAA